MAALSCLHRALLILPPNPELEVVIRTLYEFQGLEGMRTSFGDTLALRVLKAGLTALEGLLGVEMDTFQERVVGLHSPGANLTLGPCVLAADSRR